MIHMHVNAVASLPNKLMLSWADSQSWNADRVATHPSKAFGLVKYSWHWKQHVPDWKKKLDLQLSSVNLLFAIAKLAHGMITSADQWAETLKLSALFPWHGEKNQNLDSGRAFTSMNVSVCCPQAVRSDEPHHEWLLYFLYSVQPLSFSLNFCEHWLSEFMTLPFQCCCFLFFFILDSPRAIHTKSQSPLFRA